MRNLLSLALLAVLTGCSGYQLGAPKAPFRSIEIAPVRNSTSRPGTHAVLHNKLVEAFASDPRVRVGTGDAVLSTEVTKYRREGLTTQPNDAYVYSSYRVTFTVRCTLTAQNGARVLFRDREFSATATLEPRGDSSAEELSLGSNLFADIAAQIREAATTVW